MLIVAIYLLVQSIEDDHRWNVQLVAPHYHNQSSYKLEELNTIVN